MSSKRGFSLVELLVFVTILSLFFVSAAGVVTLSLKNQQINIHKIMATRMAQEAQEWIRGEKEDNWLAFTGRTGKYCVNSLTWIAIPPVCPSTINGMYKREAELTSVADGLGNIYQMNAKITVSWNENGKDYTVPVTTIYSVWE